jgi:hypothetical protein
MFNEQRRQEFAQAGFPVLPEEQQMVLEDYLAWNCGFARRHR